MESTAYLKVLRRRWKVIVASGILGAIVVVVLGLTNAALVSSSYPATASATLIQADAPRTVDFTALLVTTGPVPVAVAEKLGYTDEPTNLSRPLVVVANADTGAVNISMTSVNRDYALQLVDAFAQETLAEVRARSGGVGQFELLQPAVLQPADQGIIRGPTTPGGRLVLGLAIGLILGCALALVVERLDTRMRDRDDVETVYRVPVLAEVPPTGHSKRGEHSVVVVDHPASVAAEAYRSLRSYVMLLPSKALRTGDTAPATDAASAGRKPPQVLLITSARAGEGKTTSVVNLAAALAEGGRRVLILDADFRRPDAHRFLDVPNGPGLSDLIHAEDGPEQLLALSRPTAVEGVRLVTAGTMIDHPPGLPTRVAGLLAEARRLADVVIIDSPPMLLGNDAMDLMPYVDTVLITCRSGRPTREQVARASDLLARMRVPVVGVALIGWRSSGAPLSRFPSRGAGSSNSERMRRTTEAPAGGTGR